VAILVLFAMPSNNKQVIAGFPIAMKIECIFFSWQHLSQNAIPRQVFAGIAPTTPGKF